MSTWNNQLWRVLSEYRPKCVSQSFEEMLSKNINIREGIRAIASTSHQNLRDFLQKESERDADFPRVLSYADHDFLGGSFARHTKTPPLDDIDIYVPLDGANLFYYQSGAILPYSVLSDGLQSNPLLRPRWSDGPWVSSAKVISGVSAVLRRRFAQTKVKPAGQAVSVQMTYGETQQTSGLGFDIVPCFSLAAQRAEDAGFYLIPDGRGGWMRTNPRKDAAIADLLQENHGGNFRKIVKIVKFWNDHELNAKISSYFIELAIARALWDKAVKSEVVNTLSYGVALGFWAVQQAVLSGAQQSWLTGAPDVTPGTLLAGDLVLLKSATDLACDAWACEKAAQTATAASKWKRVFGDKFPD